MHGQSKALEVTLVPGIYDSLHYYPDKNLIEVDLLFIVTLQEAQKLGQITVLILATHIL